MVCVHKSSPWGEMLFVHREMKEGMLGWCLCAGIQSGSGPQNIGDVQPRSAPHSGRLLLADWLLSLCRRPGGTTAASPPLLHGRRLCGWAGPLVLSAGGASILPVWPALCRRLPAWVRRRACQGGPQHVVRLHTSACRMVSRSRMSWCARGRGRTVLAALWHFGNTRAEERDT